MSQNPYAPPGADIEDVRTPSADEDGRFIESGHVVAAGRGLFQLVQIGCTHLLFQAYQYLPASCVAAREGRATPAVADLSPVARDYPSRALDGFFMPPRISTVLSRNGCRVRPPAPKVHRFLPPTCSPPGPVNNLGAATCSRVIHQPAPRRKLHRIN